MILTAADKALILEDFKEWTGGFEPEECTHDQLVEYAETARPSLSDIEDARGALLTTEEVLEWLLDNKEAPQD